MDVDLEACIAGDKQAWDRLVERCAPVIYATVRRTLGRREGPGPVEVEDCVQDVFIRIVRDDFRLLRTYDPERAQLTTWLALVARSVAIDQLRRRRLPTVPLEPAAAAGRDAPASAGEGSLETSQLPLHLLTARQRLVLHLLFDRGMTVGQAAALIGVDEQTIRSTKHKALIRLRRQMAEEGDDEGRSTV
ncbi:MAG: RNA polymerase sigma factor [Planctomycetota bacterium]|jgi:RNA polymerase sigma-70 factor (ECF subfamily)